MCCAAAGVFTRTQTGSLVSRLEDISETQRAVGGLMSESLSVLLNLVLVLAAMFWLSWQLSLVALAVIPLFVLPGRVAGKRSQRLVRQEMQLSGELAAMMAERSDVPGALLAMLYGRPEEDAGVFTPQGQPGPRHDPGQPAVRAAIGDRERADRGVPGGPDLGADLVAAGRAGHDRGDGCA
jgi:ABC transporter transmembrane region